MHTLSCGIAQRSVLVAPLLVVLALAPACQQEPNWEKLRNGTSATAPTKKKEPLVHDYFLTYRALDGDADSDFADRTAFDLWAPFRVEGSTGVFYFPIFIDDRYATARSGLELRVRGSNPPQTFSILVKILLGGGVTVTAASDANADLGHITYDNVRRADVAVEYDGVSLTFLARPGANTVVTTAYDTIATVAFTQTSPLNPSFVIDGAKTNTSIDFDRFTVTANGQPPAPRDAAHEAVQLLYAAAARMAQAALAIDGLQPQSFDPGTSQIHLRAAIARLEEAATAIASIPAKSPKAAAAKSVKTARAALAKAVATLEKKGTKGINAAQKSILFKAGAATESAIDAILPADLRAALE